jgi:putative ABC transport system permease protein
MLRRTIEVISGSFIMAMQELWKNKLRTFLSVLGVTIGIFCIIGAISTVSSLERNLQNELQSLGSNSIYIDKWEWSGGADYPWWKYVNRPSPKYEEMAQIRKRTPNAAYIAFKIETDDEVEYRDNILSNVNYFGITEDFDNIQPVEIQYGRYITEADFERGNPVIVMGYEAAEKLFGTAETATGKEVKIRGKKVIIAGVIKKQGSQMIGGWEFDQSIIMSYRFARTIMDERRADPFIMVKGTEGLSSAALKDELMGAMRAVRKLSPTKEENFSLNDINDFSEEISSTFMWLNVTGAIIGAISLLVGLFGVANIMFVSVRERTAQIGLKKAVGAKRRVILTEFLIESSFLCIIGGILGLGLVFILTRVLSAALDFPVYISLSNMAWTFAICIFVGIVAGIIPAYKASRMDPVVAIRSK